MLPPKDGSFGGPHFDLKSGFLSGWSVYDICFIIWDFSVKLCYLIKNAI